jgi:RNA polymerase sigma-70 factor, ECF subfamily
MNRVEAATQIWKSVNTQLEEIICRKVKHQDCCQDILQETFLKITDNVDKIEKAVNVHAYLNRLASNAVIDYFRAKDRQTTFVDLPETALEILDENGLTQRLADSFMLETIKTLPQIYQYALLKVEVEGIPQNKLAEELGISYSGFKSRVQRAKAMLRERITACCDYKFDKYGNVISCCGSSCC